MVDKTILFSFLKCVLKWIVGLVAIILILDVIGLMIYGYLVGKEALSNIWFVIIIEGGVLMYLGFLGTTVIPQSRVIGVPWSQSVRAATMEIRKDRQRQVEFWISVGAVGFLLFIIGLFSI